MILEGLISTVTATGRPHLAAMGPSVDEDDFATGQLRRLVLRPFPTSQTAAHLRRTPAGVFHVCDDVLLLARVVLGEAGEAADTGEPEMQPAGHVNGFVLAAACRAYEFEVTTIDDSGERLRLEARVVATHDLRPFTGFNRAAHAVVEAAILVTRLHLLEASDVHRKLADLAVLVEKTGGRKEHEAFRLLADRVRAAAPHERS